jgi:preprotein translocase subunit YajC
MEFLYRLAGIATAAAEGAAAAVTDTAAATGENAAAATQQLEATNMWASLLGTFLPMLGLLVVFYFLLIRPQRKKEKQVKEMLNNLKVGDRICTIGGIYGAIKQIKDDTITLAVGNQDMTMVVARWAIRSVEEVSIENDAVDLN